MVSWLRGVRDDVRVRRRNLCSLLRNFTQDSRPLEMYRTWSPPHSNTARTATQYHTTRMLQYSLNASLTPHLHSLHTCIVDHRYPPFFTGKAVDTYRKILEPSCLVFPDTFSGLAKDLLGGLLQVGQGGHSKQE